MIGVLAAILIATPVLRPAAELGVRVHYLAPRDPRGGPWPKEERYEENVRRAKHAMRKMTSGDLMKLLRTVMRGDDWRRMPCYECIAALELLGERHDASASDTIEAFLRARLGRLSGQPDELRYRRTATDAWIETALGDLNGADALAWAANVFAAEHSSEISRFAASGLLHRELKREGWSPAVMALFDDSRSLVRSTMLDMIDLRDKGLPEHVRDRIVLFLLDPDPHLRNRVAHVLTFEPLGGEIWVPALVGFLNHPDVTPEARNTAEKALRVRGYAAKNVDGRWVAQPSLLDRYLQ